MRKRDATQTNDQSVRALASVGKGAGHTERGRRGRRPASPPKQAWLRSFYSPRKFIPRSSNQANTESPFFQWATSAARRARLGRTGRAKTTPLRGLSVGCWRNDAWLFCRCGVGLVAAENTQRARAQALVFATYIAVCILQGECFPLAHSTKPRAECPIPPARIPLPRTLCCLGPCGEGGGTAAHRTFRRVAATTLQPSQVATGG